MAMDRPRDGQGLLASLTALAATLVAIAYIRLDLLSTGLEEAREHLTSLMVLGLAALFCLGVGVVLATILLVVAFWDTHRLLVLAALSGFFLTTSLAVWSFALRKARARPRLFAAMDFPP